MIIINASAHGPIFNGQAPAIIAAYLTDVTKEVGDQGLTDVHHLLDLSIRHPTPYYETQILSERQGNDVVVHDRGIIYGPWLEGTGSRNRTTRFKGYFSFRRAEQGLHAKVPAIAQRVLQRYLGRLQ